MMQDLFGKSYLERLYVSGKSMKEMSRILKCSEHKIVYWMEKHGIRRRTRSEATYLKANPRGDPFQIKADLSPKEFFLFGLGLGIYWGEGNKVSPHAVSVGNTDLRIIKTFIRFLQTICGVKKNKMKYGLICFNDSDPLEVGKYWSKQLHINQQKFGKIVQIPRQGKGTYKKKSQTGVCAITVNNIKLKAWMMSEIDKVGKAWIV